METIRADKEQVTYKIRYIYDNQGDQEIHSTICSKESLGKVISIIESGHLILDVKIIN